MLIVKLLWPFQIYEIFSTTVEAMEAKINKFPRRWLEYLRVNTHVTMHCQKAEIIQMWKS